MTAATLEQEMGRHSVAEAMRPIRDRAVASLSSAEGPVTKQMVAEACDTLIWEKHPSSQPEWPKDTGTPAQGDQSLPLDRRRRRHQDQREAGPRQEWSRGRSKPCGVQALLSG